MSRHRRWDLMRGVNNPLAPLDQPPSLNNLDLVALAVLPRFRPPGCPRCPPTSRSLGHHQLNRETLRRVESLVGIVFPLLYCSVSLIQTCGAGRPDEQRRTRLAYVPVDRQLQPPRAPRAIPTSRRSTESEHRAQPPHCPTTSETATSPEAGHRPLEGRRRSSLSKA